MTEKKFAETLSKVLSPSRAITSPEFLRGREKRLTEIERAFAVPGRQVFIYGLRGVGKTSLALTSAYKMQSADSDIINVICSEGDTFFSVIQSVAEQALPTDPRTIKSSEKVTGKLGTKGYGIAAEKYIETGRVPEPSTLNEALSLIEFCSNAHSDIPVCVIDEFESIKDHPSHSQFARFLKGVADRCISLKFIFCGIAESVEEIFVSHGSAHRYLHTESLERMPWEARFEIIDFAASSVGIEIDRTTKIRIAAISDGFPYFVHEVTAKLLWQCFDRGYQNGMQTVAADFTAALESAIAGIELEFKGPYDRAVEKYKTDGEYILWALADTHELKRNLGEIYKSYVTICRQLDHPPLEKQKMNVRLSSFKRDSFSKIISSDRRAWYEFPQKMMRGYARLRASRKDIHLDPDHPLG
ncbi:hypothetical protein [uncultured Roseovarius sp.]|uniref:hypothetical protein n=1 Tax=uncultured Roseovarius sp. TaxID=293344 RepID=UPI002617E512|nr:hypothetical protein [uncultured Roseovarius sp.]